jgi:hypothetical protein
MNRLYKWIAIMAAAVALAACGTGPRGTPALPAVLQPANEQAAFTLRATGVQIYECRAGAGGVLAWAFVAPEAELLETSGRRAGSHGAGPHWLALDGSRIVGSVKTRADAPAAGAIPWLLLSTRSDAGAGRFTNVTSIQRINTGSGVAPADGCSQAADAGKPVRVPYTADYVFFTAR